jgi:hypothetical protein
MAIFIIHWPVFLALAIDGLSDTSGRVILAIEAARLIFEARL